MSNKSEAKTFGRLCEEFIKRADDVVEAQINGRDNKGYLGLILSVSFLEARSDWAKIRSKPEIVEKCQEQIANKMAGFIMQNEYAGTIFTLTMGEDRAQFAQEAREKGLDSLADALEMPDVAELLTP